MTHEDILGKNYPGKCKPPNRSMVTVRRTARKPEGLKHSECRGEPYEVKWGGGSCKAFWPIEDFDFLTEMGLLWLASFT